jgi:hypothetical protein
MKLFKSLLVAPATLGLLAPMAATANEVTISDFAPAEQLAITNSRVDGLEARMNNMEAGSFSETTTASFGVNFYAGITNDDDGPGNDLDDNLGVGYDFTIGLNTSFTGEDSLDVEINAGNADAPGVTELNGDTTVFNNTGVEAMIVDEISYTFPLGDKTTVMIGDNKDASSLFTTACTYGGPGNTLDDCGNKNANVDNGGAMVGVAYDFQNGVTAAFGYAGNEDDFANEEGVDAYGFNVAYTADTYGLSFTYGAQEDGGEVGFPANQDNMDTNTFYAFNGYYSPEADGLPSISVGYEVGEDASIQGNGDELSNFFAGLVWDEVGPGSLGIAMGTRIDTVEDTDAQYQYEAYYEYAVNDGMTVTPLIFVQDVAAAGTDDTTGIMVKTAFSF